MYTKDDICNMALSHIGAGKIASMDDNNEKTRVLGLYYDGAVRTALRAFPWGFARSMAKLALSTVSIPGARYMYVYPNDCMDIRRIFVEGMGPVEGMKLPFSVFTYDAVRYIGCDSPEAYVDYTAYVPIPDTYDSTFCEALSYKLAAACCPSLTGNAQKSQEMFQLYQLTIETAKHTSATEGYSEVKYPSTYIDVRGSIDHNRRWRR